MRSTPRHIANEHRPLPHATRIHVLAVVVAIAVIGLGPAAMRAVADEPASTLPNAGDTGPAAAYDSSRMQPNSVGDDRCSGEIAGWEMADSADGELGARRLEGEVVIGHPPHGDAWFNHLTEDSNFFVVPDDHNPLASDPDADYSYVLGEGNFQTGEDKEHGRVEIENEYGALPWNDAGNSGYYGIPPWAWPNTGDRAIVDGYWVYDCGHGDPGYRTEIHPAWMVVALRNMMQRSIARGSNREGWVASLGSDDDASVSPVTKADVWISSFGGEAVEDSLDELGPNGEDWWQPVNSRDYDFNIPAPPKPADLPVDAQPVIQIKEPPGSYWRPPDAVGPSFEMSNMTTFERDGRTFVHVHVPFSDVATKLYMLFAKTILVGWDVSAPDAVHLRITVNRWNVFDDIENSLLQAEYSPWLASGDQSTFVRISNGGDDDEATTFDCESDGNFMPYCRPDNGENSYVDNVSVDRFINGHDPLVVQFRAKEGEYPLENDDAGFASQAFTADDNWGIGVHHLRQNDLTFAGIYENSTGILDQCEDEPGGSCYEVTYTISRITDSTSTTIDVPSVQYAQDPNHVTATVVTPGRPDKPRRHLPVTFTFSDTTHTQVLHGTTDDNGVAAPTDLLTLPAGTYTLTVEFTGNGLLTASSMTRSVVIKRDFTASSLDVPDYKVRWGHHDPMIVTLREPNDGQAEPARAIPGKNLILTLTGLLGSQTYSVGPTDSLGTATSTPLMTLPPGTYMAKVCFAQDPWFEASCSEGLMRVTGGYAGFTRGELDVAGAGNIAVGDVHVEKGISIKGNGHRLSASAGERLEYVGTLTDTSNGSVYNEHQVPALGLAPQYLRSTYCNGANSLMSVPVKYFSTDITFKNDQTVSGIYCVTGDIKIQSRVTGTAVFVATGKITTAGGAQHLSDADPTGANVLMLAGSSASTAITLHQQGATFAGAIVADGGVEIGGRVSQYTGILVGRSVMLGGSDNVLIAR
jgi:hypothetical protein